MRHDNTFYKIVWTITSSFINLKIKQTYYDNMTKYSLNRFHILKYLRDVRHLSSPSPLPYPGASRPIFTFIKTEFHIQSFLISLKETKIS